MPPWYLQNSKNWEIISQLPKKNLLDFDFQVRDSQITSLPHKNSSRRRDVTVAWNEPLAASFLGENVPKEHLMYVLEIDPPVDKNDDNSGVTLMPACNVSTLDSGIDVG